MLLGEHSSPKPPRATHTGPRSGPWNATALIFNSPRVAPLVEGRIKSGKRSHPWGECFAPQAVRPRSETEGAVPPGLEREEEPHA